MKKDVSYFIQKNRALIVLFHSKALQNIKERKNVVKDYQTNRKMGKFYGENGKKYMSKLPNIHGFGKGDSI